MILVTGATGFIGSHLVEALAAGGYACRSLVRRAGCHLPGEVVFGDLAGGGSLDQALRGIELVIHLAGVTKALSPAGYYAGNTRATEVLASAIAGRGIRLVYVSSLAAVGPSLDGTPLTEDAEPHPLTDYGKSKLAAERSVRALLSDAVIVRPPVVYGPRDTGVFEFLKLLSKGLAPEIRGGERWFSAIYVTDLVEGILAAAFAGCAAGRTYFLAPAQPVCWSELAATAARIMGRRAHTIRIPRAAALAIGYGAQLWSRATGKPGVLNRDKIREAQCLCWTCDPQRAAAELGFHARTALADGLAQTLAWYKGAGWLHY